MSSIIEPDKRCAKTTQQPENHPLKFQAVGKKRKRERGDKTTKTQNPGATATATLASFSTLSQIKSNIHPNFEELSASYPNFAQKWEKLRQRQKKSKQGRGGGSSLNAHVDFDLNVALSRAILDKYFNLNLKCMPRGYLCPPIPNRFNYVLWIKELLNDSSPSHDESKSKSESESSKYFQESQRLHVVRHGIDLGIGVSCIYPLLLSSHEFTNDQSWRFLGTDIDPYSIKCAQENIDANGLQEVIKLALVSPAPIDRGCGLKTVSITDETNGGNSPDQNDITTPLNTAMKAASHTYQENEVMFDFCMSNPPFYSNSDEATVPRSGDGRNRTDMTFHESVYPGGELGFALDMLHDSFSYRERITWYTLMVSKKSSLIAFEKELAKVGFHRGSVRTTEFVQGNMMRWGVAWTFLTPSVRSPAMKLVGGVSSLTVILDTDFNKEEARKEVCDRFKCFFEELRIVELNCVQHRDNHLVISERGMRVGVQANKRHLLMDAYIDSGNSITCSSVEVRLESFTSTPEGVEMVRKVQRQLQGEICRTNRRWRRLKKKEL